MWSPLTWELIHSAPTRTFLAPSGLPPNSVARLTISPIVYWLILHRSIVKHLRYKGLVFPKEKCLPYLHSRSTCCRFPHDPRFSASDVYQARWYLELVTQVRVPRYASWTRCLFVCIQYHAQLFVLQNCLTNDVCLLVHPSRFAVWFGIASHGHPDVKRDYQAVDTLRTILFWTDVF